ncbi:MAG: methyltransferase domain-containing protein [Chloroflexi bacterium]|nr:methyltransferase domain-containing protein [Chloroflexota bacterium]
MMTPAQRQDVEHFDRYWRDEFQAGKRDLRVAPDEEIWRRDLGYARRVAFEWLGDLRGKRVLELGCGSGDNTVLLARRGARVAACDLAPSAVAITRERARVNRLDTALSASVMLAETLAFENETFDWAVGFGLLHHADLAPLAREVKRVLRCDGRALFFEPLGTNPVLEFARHHLPYRDKHHSQNEHPLRYTDVNTFGAIFRAMRTREFYLFSMITRALGNETSFPLLSRLDEFLIARVPAVRAWCRYILVEYAA